MVESLKNNPHVKNAFIRPFNRLVAVTNVEVFDEKLSIWRGDIIKNADQKDTLGKEIFFSRSYDKDANELDMCLNEYEITDEDVIGFPFLLIPSEKILFAYEKGTLIQIPRGIGKKLGRGRRPVPQ
jgi:hypothetical protein